MFPNQLLSALIRGHRLYLPNIGAMPEPPERFDVNVQALVNSVDTGALSEVASETVNLNQQIDVETAAPPPSLDRTFANDVVAIDANLAGDTFLLQLDIDSAERPPWQPRARHSRWQAGVLHGTGHSRQRHLRHADPQLRAAEFQGQDVKGRLEHCGSCHPDGLADGVTWSFGTGPRQTIPLDGMFSKQSLDDQRLLNWSGVRGSNTDFNANSRVTQGGCGFASDLVAPGQCFTLGNMTPANSAIYDHGIGGHDLDAADGRICWCSCSRSMARLPASAPRGTTSGMRSGFRGPARRRKR